MAPSGRWKKWARPLGSHASVSARLKPRHCGSCGILAAAASYERFSPTFRQTAKGCSVEGDCPINQREQNDSLRDGRCQTAAVLNRVALPSPSEDSFSG